jgi:hypothetical protein
MESKNKTIKINLSDGTAEYYTLTEEEYNDGWVITPEGYINHNGIIADYWHGNTEEDEHIICGAVLNMKNAGIIPEGLSIEDYRKDVQSMVHDLFSEFDQYGKPRRLFNADKGWSNPPIEFYVDNPNLLDFFYNRYPHKKVPHKTYVVPIHPRFEEEEVPFRMAA